MRNILSSSGMDGRLLPVLLLSAIASLIRAPVVDDEWPWKECSKEGRCDQLFPPWTLRPRNVKRPCPICGAALIPVSLSGVPVHSQTDLALTTTTCTRHTSGQNVGGYFRRQNEVIVGGKLNPDSNSDKADQVIRTIESVHDLECPKGHVDQLSIIKLTESVQLDPSGYRLRLPSPTTTRTPFQPPPGLSVGYMDSMGSQRLTLLLNTIDEKKCQKKYPFYHDLIFCTKTEKTNTSKTIGIAYGMPYVSKDTHATSPFEYILHGINYVTWTAGTFVRVDKCLQEIEEMVKQVTMVGKEHETSHEGPTNSG